MPRSDIFGVGGSSRLLSPLRDDAVRTSSSSSSFMSLVSLTLSFTSNTNRREREIERKLCISFDDDLCGITRNYNCILRVYAPPRDRRSLVSSVRRHPWILSFIPARAE